MPCIRSSNGSNSLDEVVRIIDPGGRPVDRGFIDGDVATDGPDQGQVDVGLPALSQMETALPANLSGGVVAAHGSIMDVRPVCALDFRNTVPDQAKRPIRTVCKQRVRGSSPLASTE